MYIYIHMCTYTYICVHIHFDVNIYNIHTKSPDAPNPPELYGLSIYVFQCVYIYAYSTY